MKTFAKHNRGQSLVEFALVIPILLLLMVGIMEFSRAWMTQNILTSAAREGARVGAVSGQAAGEAAAVNVLHSANINSAGVNVATSPPGPPYGDVTATSDTGRQRSP